MNLDYDSHFLYIKLEAVTHLAISIKDKFRTLLTLRYKLLYSCLNVRFCINVNVNLIRPLSHEEVEESYKHHEGVY